MPKRLSELYAIGTHVELRLSDAGWSAGRVVAHDFPGIWVAIEKGGRWFVTNHRHIRQADADDDDSHVGSQTDQSGDQGANEL
jgi:hypothetical protein